MKAQFDIVTVKGAPNGAPFNSLFYKFPFNPISSADFLMPFMVSSII